MKSSDTCDFDKEVVSIFEGHESTEILWQPRIEHWFNVNRVIGSLPTNFKGLSLAKIYELLNAYMRLYIFPDEVYGFRPPPYGEGGLQSPIKTCIDRRDEVVIKRLKEDGKKITTIYSTPRGSLLQVERSDKYGVAWYLTKYPITSVEDFRIMEDVLESINYTFDIGLYLRLKDWLAGQGSIWACSPRSPLAKLIIELMGPERTFKALFRNRKEVEEFMEIIERANFKWIKMIQSTPIKVVTIGDNLDVFLISPRLFEKYCLEYYLQFCEKMHKAGKFVLVHADGRLKGLLPLIRQSGVDGVEAVTFKPVGDVTLEEVHRIFKDELVLVDGLPYNLFLRETCINELKKMTIKVVSAFSPRLILGVSDELPPDGEIERIKFVSELLNHIRSNKN